MPRRRKPTVPAQPVPQPVKTPRRFARRRRYSEAESTPTATQGSSSSNSIDSASTATSRKAEAKKEILRRKRLLLKSEYLNKWKKLINLVDLPEDVLDKIFLHVLDTPHSSQRTLENKSLGNWELITQIGISHPTLYKVMTKLISTIVINPNDIIAPPELVIASASLRNLHIHGHSLTERILQEFAGSGHEFKGNVVHLDSLYLENIDIPVDPFTKIIKQSKSLKSLALSFTHLPELPQVLSGLGSSFTSLKCLKLHGISNLTGDCILNICEKSQQSLTQLSLRYLRHPSVSDACLLSITKLCQSLSSIDLEHLFHCSDSAIYTLCIFYNRIRILRLVDLSLSQVQLRDILLHVCGTLNALSLEDTMSNPTITDIDCLTDVLCTLLSSVPASAELSSNLHSLDLRNIPTLTDFHMVRLLESNSQTIRSLTIKHSINVTDTTCFHINKYCSETLRHLDLRNCVISDYGLQCLSDGCTQLSDIFLGSDGTKIQWHDVGLYDNSVITNDGMDQLLQCCGTSLTQFFWETPRTVLPGDGPIRFHTVGNHLLDGKQLAKSLLRYCRRLLKVDVNWLKPSGNLVAKRAEYELAFFELDNALPRVSITLDREPL